jgi:hypothetical protein
VHGWHSRAQPAADGGPVCGRDPVIRYTVLLPLAPVLLGSTSRVRVASPSEAGPMISSDPHGRS